jgi:hypothetical protein
MERASCAWDGRFSLLSVLDDSLKRVIKCEAMMMGPSTLHRPADACVGVLEPFEHQIVISIVKLNC